MSTENTHLLLLLPGSNGYGNNQKRFGEDKREVRVVGEFVLRTQLCRHNGPDSIPDRTSGGHVFRLFPGHRNVQPWFIPHEDVLFCTKDVMPRALFFVFIPWHAFKPRSLPSPSPGLMSRRAKAYTETNDLSLFFI